MINNNHGVPCKNKSNQSIGAMGIVPRNTRFSLSQICGSGVNGANPSDSAIITKMSVFLRKN